MSEFTQEERALLEDQIVMYDDTPWAEAIRAALARIDYLESLIEGVAAAQMSTLGQIESLGLRLGESQGRAKAAEALLREAMAPDGPQLADLLERVAAEEREACAAIASKAPAEAPHAYVAARIRARGKP